MVWQLDGYSPRTVQRSLRLGSNVYTNNCRSLSLDPETGIRLYLAIDSDEEVYTLLWRSVVPIIAILDAKDLTLE